MRSTFKVLFNLNRDKSKVRKVVPVMGCITVNGCIAQFSTKVSVPPGAWDIVVARSKAAVSTPTVLTATWIISKGK